jgi:hypothetical protein
MNQTKATCAHAWSDPADRACETYWFIAMVRPQDVSDFPLTIKSSRIEPRWMPPDADSRHKRR